MYLLVVVFALSVLALLSAAWAIRRSIRRHGQQKERVGLGLDQPAPSAEDAEDH